MFEVGKIYKRKEIHDRYRGNRQSGISPSAVFPYIFIFSGKSGEKYGYEDKWDENHVFHYTGEGKLGPMHFLGVNGKLRDHIQDNKRVFLFTQTKKSFVRYEGEMECLGWEPFQGRDESWTMRSSIKFFFKRVGDEIETKEEYQNKVAENASEEYIQSENPTKTERSGMVVSRVGQGKYRKKLLSRWDEKCAVTGCDDIRVLVASHIVPWKDSTSLERMDQDNGILLSPIYDALFDRHLISFKADGKIILSKDLKKKNFSILGITGTERIVGLSEGNKKYLERHRDKLL